MARGQDISRPAIVRSHVESALGSWHVTSFEPPADDVLLGVVQAIWLFSGSTTAPRERVFPDGTLELVFQLDGAYRPVDERGATSQSRRSRSSVRRRARASPPHFATTSGSRPNASRGSYDFVAR